MDLRLLAVTGLAMFLTTFDITAVVMAMPGIRAAMDLDIGGFAWVMDAYSLAFTVCLMAAGLLADRFGRRRAFVAGTALFAVASLACAAAPGIGWLLAARAAQGVAAAFVVCAGIALAADRHRAPGERARAFGVLGMVNGSAMAVGPAGGGLLAQAAGWEWIFLANVPLALLVVAGTFRWVAESCDAAARRVDVAGVATLGAWLLCAVAWLMHGSRLGGRELPVPVGVAVLVLLGLAFLRTQRRAAHPVFDLSLFARPDFAALCGVHLALSVGYWSVLVFVPLLLLEGLGVAARDAPVVVLAATVPMVVLPGLSARVAARMPAAAFFGAGLAAVAAGAGLVALAAALHSLPLALAGLALSGAATALLGAQALAGVVGAVPAAKAGAASAVTIILRQGGFALGIALLTAAARAVPAPRGPGWLVFAVAAAVTAVGAAAVTALLLHARVHARAHHLQGGATRP